MLIMLLKNLQKGTDETVSFLAFTPAPQVITLRLLVLGEQTVRIGEVPDKAVQYVFKPQIGMIRKCFGKALGKLPAHFHYDCWMLADEVSGFINSKDPCNSWGRSVQIEVVTPRLPESAEDGKFSSK